MYWLLHQFFVSLKVIWTKFSSMNWTLLSLLLFIALTSCTITKQRYSCGYHVEWNTRKVAAYSDKVSENKAFDPQKIAVPSDKEVMEIRSKDTLHQVNPEISESYERVEMRPLVYKKVVKTPEKIPGVLSTDRSTSKVMRNGNFQQSEQSDFASSRSDIGEALSDFFFVFCIILMLLVIPPLLHTMLVASLFHFKNDTLFLVLEWLIWAAGIVCIVFFFSSALTIVLTCLGWNLLFALFVSAFILNR